MSGAAGIYVGVLLADAGNVEDLESLTEWREFIRGETGIELIIEHPAS